MYFKMQYANWKILNIIFLFLIAVQKYYERLKNLHFAIVSRKCYSLMNTYKNSHVFLPHAEYSLEQKIHCNINVLEMMRK